MVPIKRAIEFGNPPRKPHQSPCKPAEFRERETGLSLMNESVEVSDLRSGVLTSPADALVGEAIASTLRLPAESRAEDFADRMRGIEAYMKECPEERPWSCVSFTGTDGSRIFRGGGRALARDRSRRPLVAGAELRGLPHHRYDHREDLRDRNAPAALPADAGIPATGRRGNGRQNVRRRD